MLKKLMLVLQTHLKDQCWFFKGNVGFPKECFFFQSCVSFFFAILLFVLVSFLQSCQKAILVLSQFFNFGFVTSSQNLLHTFRENVQYNHCFFWAKFCVKTTLHIDFENPNIGIF